MLTGDSDHRFYGQKLVVVNPMASSARHARLCSTLRKYGSLRSAQRYALDSVDTYNAQAEATSLCQARQSPIPSSEMRSSRNVYGKLKGDKGSEFEPLSQMGAKALTADALRSITRHNQSM